MRAKRAPVARVNPIIPHVSWKEKPQKAPNLYRFSPTAGLIRAWPGTDVVVSTQQSPVNESKCWKHHGNVKSPEARERSSPVGRGGPEEEIRTPCSFVPQAVKLWAQTEAAVIVFKVVGGRGRSYYLQHGAERRVHRQGRASCVRGKTKTLSRLKGNILILNNKKIRIKVLHSVFLSWFILITNTNEKLKCFTIKISYYDCFNYFILNTNELYFQIVFVHILKHSAYSGDGWHDFLL